MQDDGDVCPICQSDRTMVNEDGLFYCTDCDFSDDEG